MARVSYTDEEDVPPEDRHLLESALQGRTINAYRVLGANLEILRGLRSFLSALWQDTGLSPRRRELITLAVARELESAYEWQQHVRIATGEGITRAEMLAISEREYSAFEQVEKTLLRYAAAVLNGDVDDGLHADMAARFDESTVVGVTLLVAGYRLAACFLDVLEVDLEDQFVGWDLERFSEITGDG
jgi:alkylhydroperoxidase family enzyme